MVKKQVILGVFLVGAATIALPASAQAPGFGPVASSHFHWKGGSTIERPTDDCQMNSDWLLIEGTNVGTTKKLEISPRTQNSYKHSFPLTQCSGAGCFQAFIKISPRDPVGPRTVTLTDGAGKTATTTFEVVENAGRCDYPKGPQGK